MFWPGEEGESCRHNVSKRQKERMLLYSSNVMDGYSVMYGFNVMHGFIIMHAVQYSGQLRSPVHPTHGNCTHMVALKLN